MVFRCLGVGCGIMNQNTRREGVLPCPMAFPFYFVSDGILSFPKESIQRTAFKGRGISIFPFLLSPFCLRRDTFFPWRKKVSKERHLRGEGFRFPSPLKNPLSLKRPKREGCGPPSLETSSGGLGDYQIAPLPQSGKGRWRPRAAGGIKRGTDSHASDVGRWLGMTGQG